MALTYTSSFTERSAYIVALFTLATGSAVTAWSFVANAGANPALHLVIGYSLGTIAVFSAVAALGVARNAWFALARLRFRKQRGQAELRAIHARYRSQRYVLQ